MGFTFGKISIDGPTPILRIIRQDGRFICGVCRQSHLAEGAAAGCLDSCMRNFFLLDPVVAIDTFQYQQFRCRICCREYALYNEAYDCAAECKEDLIRKDEKIKTFKVADPAAKPRKLQFQPKLKAVFAPSKVTEVIVEAPKLLEEIAPLAAAPKPKAVVEQPKPGEEAAAEALITASTDKKVAKSAETALNKAQVAPKAS